MTEVIRLVCRDRSHEGKAALVDRYARQAPGEPWLAYGPGEGQRDTPATPLRFRLACPLCDLNVTVRAETLYPVLDRLAAERVPEVELRHLARIIGG